MRISARIWSGVSIILVGYLLTVMVGAWLGYQSSVKLDAARIAALPATLKMYELRTEFTRALSSYQAAVLEGEPANLKAAQASIDAVKTGLDDIATQSWLPTSRRDELSQLANKTVETHGKAMVLYRRMAGGESSDEIKASGVQMQKTQRLFRQKFRRPLKEYAMIWAMF